MAVSIVFLAGMAFGAISFPDMTLPYAAIICAFLAVRLAAFALVRAKFAGAGRTVPRVSPFRWLVIRETPAAWTVGEYRFRKGMTEPAVYQKYRGTTATEAAPYLENPEVRRVRYHSYITTVEREGTDLVVADPLRESRAIFYPPHFTRVRIPLRGRSRHRGAPADPSPEAPRSTPGRGRTVNASGMPREVSGTGCVRDDCAELL